MIISDMIIKDYYIISLHIEEVYNNIKNKSKDKHIDYQGIYTRYLSSDTFINIRKSICSSKSAYKYYVFDFKNIEEVHNLNQYLSELIEFLINKKANVIIANVSNNLRAENNLNINHVIEYSQNKGFKCRELRNKQLLLIHNDLNNRIISIIESKNYKDIYKLKFQDYKEQKLLEITIDNNHHNELKLSSPIILSKYIDIKKLIEDKKAFFLFSYFFLEELMSKNVFNIFPNDNKKYVLFSQTLNGAYISALFSQLLCIDRFYINHLGPIKKFERLNLFKNINKEKKYIIVSDLVCLGTETSIAKSIIEYACAEVSACIAFVGILTSSSIEDSKKYFITITKDYNPINYSIETLIDGSDNI